jgi:hypothetical protein
MIQMAEQSVPRCPDSVIVEGVTRGVVTRDAVPDDDRNHA